jgi:diguanylate cyclase (GGDEF)-like protein
MIDVVRDMILAASGILVLVVLNRTGAGKRRVPKTVWPYLLSGFGLLLLGRVSEMLPAETLGVPQLTKGLLQEILGFCLGFLLLAIGLLRWLPDVLGGQGAKKPKAPRPVSVVQPAGDQQGGHGAQEMLTSVLKSSLSGVMVVKAVRDDTEEIVDFQCVVMNEAAQQILGRSAAQFVGRRVLKEFPCIKAENLLGHMVSVIETGLPYRNEREFNHDRNGRWYQFVAVKLGDGLAVTFVDVSDRKQAEEKLRHAAHHDTLTGLPNRALFMERLDQAIVRAQRFNGYAFAVLFLDFDRFKFVNDTLGHDAGDQLLIGIADRLREILAPGSPSTKVSGDHLPARLGGDEFVVLLDNIQGVEDAVAVADKMLEVFSQPHTLAGQSVVSTASIGIVASTLGYESSDDMIRDADTAMYRAKMGGKARHVVFDDRMHQEVVARLNLERELRTAVDQLTFDLAFDPIIDLESGRLAGLETQVIWPHATLGTLRAHEFLGIAEETNLVVPIDVWKLRRACEQLKVWQEAHPAQGGLAINVNASRHLLRHPGLIETVKAAVEDTGIKPGSLRLEISAEMLTNEPNAFSSIVDELRSFGVRLVIDHFGSDHSSLSCLHRFPITMVKMDGAFISSVQRPRDYGAIMHAVVELAHNLGMQVVADGLERPEEIAMLQALDCDFGQGTVFSELLGIEDVDALLAGDTKLNLAA